MNRKVFFSVVFFLAVMGPSLLTWTDRATGFPGTTVLVADNDQVDSSDPFDAAPDANEDGKEQDPGDTVEKKNTKAQAQVARKETPPATASMIRVPVPISDGVEKSAVRQLRRLVESTQPGQPGQNILIFEFLSAEDGSGGKTGFGEAYDLARQIVSQEVVERFRTVAYIPRDISDLSLLPIMACNEIIMNKSATLGGNSTSPDEIRTVGMAGFQDIAARRNTLPAALAVGLLDPSRGIYRVKVGGGYKWAIGAEQRDELEKQGSDSETIFEPGVIGSATATELRDRFGAVSRVVVDRSQLADALGVDKITIDPKAGGQWKPIRVDLTGIPTGWKVNKIQNAISRAVEQDEVNLVIIEINSEGGAPEDIATLASFLSDLDQTQVYTIAWIPQQARGDAAIAAMACDAIYMTPDAILGGEGSYAFQPLKEEDAIRTMAEAARKGEIAPLDPSSESILIATIIDVGTKKNRRWSLWAAMIDRDLKVFECREKGTGRVAWLSDPERDNLPDPRSWIVGKQVTDDNMPFKVDGTEAVEFSLAEQTTPDFEALKRTLDLKEVPSPASNWVLDFVEFLAREHIVWLLLFIGVMALFSELSAPGVGVPGFIAGLCFIIFFWSQALHGTAGWLEVMMFVVGVVCIVLELLVIPGFGIFGIGGGLLIILSVVFASQTFFIPQTAYQFRQLPVSLLSVIAMIAGVFLSLFVLRKYLHKTPVFRRVVLAPPIGEEGEEISRRESMVDWENLVGQVGVTTTPLVPAGKILLNDRLVDVSSDGELIEPETRVVVDRVLGNLVYVRPVIEE